MIELYADRTGLTGGVHMLDVVTGTEDPDTLFGSDGNDTISGLGGDDQLNAEHGLDSVDGGDGADRILLGGDAGDTVHGGAGADFIECVIEKKGFALGGIYAGDAGDDVLRVAAVRALASDSVTLQGGDGDDQLFDQSRGDDLIDGGDGSDYLIFRRSGRSVSVDLTLGVSDGKLIGHNTLLNIELVQGSRADDVLIGSSSGNTLIGKNGADAMSGMAGDDSLYGGGGGDTITGGQGADELAGGGGRDTFVFTSVTDSPTFAPDTIDDLKKHDVIDLSAIDADVNTAGDQAFIRVNAFDGHAGQMTLSFAGGVTTMRLDVDGDAVADMAVTIWFNHLTYHGFVL